jgi:hypothetical protein
MLTWWRPARGGDGGPTEGKPSRRTRAMAEGGAAAGGEVGSSAAVSSPDLARGGIHLPRSRRQLIWARTRADGLQWAGGAGRVEEEELVASRRRSGAWLLVPCYSAEGQRCLRCAAEGRATLEPLICHRGGGDGGRFGRPWRWAVRCGCAPSGVPILRVGSTIVFGEVGVAFSEFMGWRCCLLGEE